MSILKLLNYYQNKTKIYYEKLNLAIDKLLSSKQNKKSFECSFEYFDELIDAVINSLKKISKELYSIQYITPEDINEFSNDRIMLRQNIQNDFQYEL